MPTKQIICISLIANSNEELKIELMMDLQIFTRMMNINFIDEYVDILDNMEWLLKIMFSEIQHDLSGTKVTE